MRTLKEIEGDGDVAEYMMELGATIEAYLPSQDGTPGNRCRFVIVIEDDDGLSSIAMSVGPARAADMLHAAIEYVEKHPGELT